MTGLLIYDGDCAFCSTSVRWIMSHWDGHEEAVPWQRISAERLSELGLTHDDVRRAVWWVDPSRPPSRGHVAVAHALKDADGWPAMVGRVLLVPPFRWLAAGVYPLVARWRHRLPGGTPACRL